MLLVGFGAVLLVRIAGEARLAVVPFIVALLLTTALAPPAAALRRRGAPAALAAAVVLLGFVGAVAGTLALLGPTVGSEMDDLGRQVRSGAEEALDRLSGLGLLENDTDGFLDQVIAQLKANAGGIGSGVVTGALVAAELVAGALLALVSTFFLLKDGDRLWRRLVAGLGPARGEAVDEIGRGIWLKLGAYVRGTIVVALFDAVFIGLALWVIGVPLVVPLAVLTFATAFIPIIGATVAGAAAVLVALVTGGMHDALLALAAVIAVQQIESQLLSPVVVGRAVRVHPLAILLAVTAGGVLAGILGAALATPLLAAIVTAAQVVQARTARSRIALAHPPSVAADT